MLTTAYTEIFNLLMTFEKAHLKFPLLILEIFYLFIYFF